MTLAFKVDIRREPIRVEVIKKTYGPSQRFSFLLSPRRRGLTETHNSESYPTILHDYHKRAKGIHSYYWRTVFPKQQRGPSSSHV